MLKRIAIAVLIAATMGLAGCRMATVQNVTNAPVMAKPGQLTQEDVGKAILRAGLQLGWQMTEKSPGLIEATLRLRTHMAKVHVTYDTKTYSITYVDSADLQYDGTMIHQNYNGWVQNLDKGIKIQLSTL